MTGLCGRCGHLDRYHGPSEGCHYPVAPIGLDCGCEALRTQPRAQSGELTYTPTTQEPQ